MLQMSRREMLHVSGASAVALALAPLGGLTAAQKEAAKGTYQLPKLKYGYGDLKEAIDAETMRIHHTLHHQAYVDNANKLLAKTPKLAAMPVRELLKVIKTTKDVPDEATRQGLINNAGGHYNHSLFWEIMTPEKTEPKGKLLEAIKTTKDLGSVEALKKAINNAGLTQFGSGWAWLVVNKDGGLQVVKTANQDCPLMVGQTPIFGVDVWEHAYYLRYQNKRAAYLEAWWKVANWDAIGKRYESATKA